MLCSLIESDKKHASADICEYVVKYVLAREKKKKKRKKRMKAKVFISWFIYTCGAPAQPTRARPPADLRKMRPERALFVCPRSVDGKDMILPEKRRAALSEQ